MIRMKSLRQVLQAVQAVAALKELHVPFVMEADFVKDVKGPDIVPIQKTINAAIAKEPVNVRVAMVVATIGKQNRTNVKLENHEKDVIQMAARDAVGGNECGIRVLRGR